MPIASPEAPQPQGNPYAPTSTEPLVCDQFGGINTQATRVGVDDKQMFWCSGYFPIGPRCLRTVPGIGPTLYAPALGILFFDSYNIDATPYHAVFLADGSVVQVNTETGATTTILPAGGIIGPSLTTVGTTQWGSAYLIIVSTQPNGYWIWDGADLFTAGTIGPIVTLTDVGSGYKTVPSVTASGGSGSGATFSAAIANGVVTGVTVVNAGHGYLAGQTITLVFTGGNSGGTGANLTAVLTLSSGSGASLTPIMADNGDGTFRVSGVNLVSGGTNYSQFATITVSGGAGGSTRVDAVMSPIVSAGVITGANVTSGGNYTAPTPLPTITVMDNGMYFVSSVTIVSGGSGYSPSAIATCSGGGTPHAQASLTLTINASGVITAVAINNGGVYETNTPPTITVTDTVRNAAATATLMPFAIQGNSVETYQGRVWVVNGNDLFFSAPGSFVDFATSNGGGSLTSSDSFLRVTYVRLIATSGFLYLLGDSSISYISGVQTSGSPPTTTFTIQNADPEVGTPYPASATVFGRNIVLANSIGVHVSYGAAVTKISQDLDGVYNTIPNFAGQQLSAAKTTIFGKKVWILLVPVVDPVTGNTSNELFMWDGAKKWFSSKQDKALTFINFQEINSVLTAWGTDGASLFPLFQDASVAFTKTMQTKLWTSPGGYQFNKAIGRFWGIVQYFEAGAEDFDITIDTEYSANPYVLSPPDVEMLWTLEGTTPMIWTTDGVTPMTWSLGPVGIRVFAPQAVGQQGVLNGFTASTNAADAAIISMMIQPEPVGYRG